MYYATAYPCQSLGYEYTSWQEEDCYEQGEEEEEEEEEKSDDMIVGANKAQMMSCCGYLGLLVVAFMGAFMAMIVAS